MWAQGILVEDGVVGSSQRNHRLEMTSQAQPIKWDQHFNSHRQTRPTNDAFGTNDLRVSCFEHSCSVCFPTMPQRFTTNRLKTHSWVSHESISEPPHRRRTLSRHDDPFLRILVLKGGQVKSDGCFENRSDWLEFNINMAFYELIVIFSLFNTQNTSNNYPILIFPCRAPFLSHELLGTGSQGILYFY